MNSGRLHRSCTGKLPRCARRTGKSARPHTSCDLQSYNVGVSAEPHDSEPHNENDRRHLRHAIYATETAGLLLIAFLLLASTIIRYWHAIHWSLR
jgi:hypothetical protein